MNATNKPTNPAIAEAFANATVKSRAMTPTEQLSNALNLYFTTSNLTDEARELEMIKSIVGATDFSASEIAEAIAALNVNAPGQALARQLVGDMVQRKSQDAGVDTKYQPTDCEIIHNLFKDFREDKQSVTTVYDVLKSLANKSGVDEITGLALELVNQHALSIEQMFDIESAIIAIKEGKEFKMNDNVEAVLEVVEVAKRPSLFKRVAGAISGPVAAGLLAGIGAALKAKADDQQSEDGQSPLIRIAGYAVGAAAAQAVAEKVTPAGSNVGTKALSAVLLGTATGGVAAVGARTLASFIPSFSSEVEEGVDLEEKIRGE